MSEPCGGRRFGAGWFERRPAGGAAASGASATAWSSTPGWRGFLDLLGDAVVVVANDGRVRFANTAALRLSPFEAGTPIESLRGVLGAAAVGWIVDTLAGAPPATPEPPTGRLGDGRRVELDWRRLDAEHAGLRLVVRTPATTAAARVARSASRVGEPSLETLGFLWESPFPATLQDADFRLIDVNPAFVALTGRPREALLGLDPRALEPAVDGHLPEPRPPAPEAGAAAIPPVVERRLLDASGREHRVRIAQRALGDGAGGVCYLGLLQDTTAEHSARERADRSLRELDDWFELSPVGMVLLDARGVLLRHNDAFVALTGTPPATLAEAAPDLADLLGWDDATGRMAALDPAAPPVVRQAGIGASGGAPARALRAVLRCYRSAGGEPRTMAVVEDRSAEEASELAQHQIGALMETAGVGLATFQESSGWMRLQPAGGGGDVAAGSASPAGTAASLQSIGRDLVLPESIDEFDRLQAALRDARRVQVRYAIGHPDLGRRWLLTRVEPATLASGARTTSVVTLDITEQHETQQRTEQLLHELGIILESTTAGIAYLRDDTLVRCNRRFEAMLGLAAGSAEGRPFERFFARRAGADGEVGGHGGGERGRALVASARRGLADDGLFETELEAVTGADFGVPVATALTGEPHWYSLSLRGRGTPERVDEAVAVLTDISRLKAQQRQLEVLARDRERAAQAIALQAERTRAILDSALVGIVTVGLDGIEWMNRSARRMFGGELSAFAGQPLATVATPEPDHPFRRTVDAGELGEAGQGRTDTFECRLRARDGREFWVVGNVVATGTEAGGRQWTWALLDIERRRQAEARVSETQAQLQRIIESAPLAITLRDARTLRVLQVNEVAARILGRPPEAIVGRTPEELSEAPRAAIQRADMEAAVRSQAPTRHEYRVGAAGETRIWDVRYLPLAVRGSAAPEELLTVATDVTEQRAAQEARFEAAIAQREMLVKEVHHRIKNNLQGVAGLLQQIAEKKPEVAGPIAEVVGQVQAIAQVYGLQVGADGPLGLVAVVQAIAASVQRTFGRAIVVAIGGARPGGWRLPEAESIPIALTLNELLTNAVKHGGAAPAGEVRCELESRHDGVEIRIGNPGALPDGFDLARIPGGVSGLGLVRALLPRRSATLTLGPVEGGGRVEARVGLRPPSIELGAAPEGAVAAGASPTIPR